MHDKLTELETKALTLDNLILWIKIQLNGVPTHPERCILRSVLDQVNG